MSRKNPIPYAELPELCYSEVNGHLVTVKKGASRFERSPLDTGEAKGCREIARLKNELLGVTPEQRSAMCSGVIFGWNMPNRARSVSPKQPFSISIYRTGISGDQSYATVKMPATPCEIWEALDIARITNESVPHAIEIESCELEYLPQFIAPDSNIHELNHLAQRLSALDEHGLHCFEGMTMMDAIKTKYSSIALERLINFTHSTEGCQIAAEACDDASLGKFYVDNDFPVIPPNLPEELYEMLDYESIGRKAREGEGGVFTPHGYVVQTDKIAEIYHRGDAVPKEKPRCTILLEVCKGYFNDPEYDNDRTERLHLPAAEYQLAEAITAVEAASEKECAFTAVDCIVPALTELIADALEDDVGCYAMVNELAGQLSRLEQKGLLTTYKAMLYAAPEDTTLAEALDISYDTEGFILSKGLTSTADYARDQLGQCGVPMLDKLCATANLYAYGTLLMLENHVVETPYGLLRSVDGLTMKEALNRKPPEQGMEMR